MVWILLCTGKWRGQRCTQWSVLPFVPEHVHYALSICDLPAKPVNSKRAQVVNLLAVLATTVSQEGLEIVEHVHPLPRPWVFPHDMAFMREVQFVVQTRDHSLFA